MSGFYFYYIKRFQFLEMAREFWFEAWSLSCLPSIHHTLHPQNAPMMPRRVLLHSVISLLTVGMLSVFVSPFSFFMHSSTLRTSFAPPASSSMLPPCTVVSCFLCKCRIITLPPHPPHSVTWSNHNLRLLLANELWHFFFSICFYTAHWTTIALSWFIPTDWVSKSHWGRLTH